MPAVPHWAYPNVFDLTNPFNGNLSFNEQTSSGIYLLIQDGCDFHIDVRSTTDNIPQANGSILHTRFLTGVTIPMTVQLWESRNEIACSGELLAEMLDNLSGALRSLLNAGDNEGRLAYQVDGQNDRMVDDVRLAVYPTFTPGPPPTVTFTLDTQYPYAQDLLQNCTHFSDGVPQTLDNTGSADYHPVFLVNVSSCSLPYDGDVGAVSDFTITVDNIYGITQFVYSDAFAGAVPIPSGAYAEINAFGNTIYQDGTGADLKAGVDELNSDYPVFATGSNDVQIDGADMVVLWAPAWG